ncbi:MAG TPA: anaerobic ribonucleoside triphosphate reductase, partial [Ruminococcaceae bacterium]|nr:anaerobic ribonucleoside triphosphate reductase [Oscillospiraceae bacterium]
TYFQELAKYIQAVHGMSFGDAQALTQAVKKDVGAGITMGGADGYGRKLREYLPAHQQAGGFEPISAQEAQGAHAFAVENALRITERTTYQAMEALIHNLNTMNSRAGAQVPFSSLNYGTDTSPEGRMVMKNLLLATEAGLGQGETPIFPVQIFKVKEGVNYNPGDPNYDLFKLSIKVSAKRLFPNFSFLDAPFNLQYYKPGDYNTEVAYMGCRTRVMGNVHDRSREVTCGRGNLSFTSINLPRIGIEAHGDVKKFYAILDERIDLVIRQL